MKSYTRDRLTRGAVPTASQRDLATLVSHAAGQTVPGEAAQFQMLRQGLWVAVSFRAVTDVGRMGGTGGTVGVGGDSGDGDARIEPGEAWYADLTVGNAGAVLAADVSAYLSTDSGHISFSDSSEDFGDINPGRSAASSSGFRFTVLASHPGGDTPAAERACNLY